MSMYRQLWLAILAGILIAVVAALAASLMSARGYLEAQLAMKNRDNATALALALSRPDSDHDDVVLAATALFDGGHYQLVQVVDADGRVLLDRVAPQADTGVPGWFARLAAIRSLPASAEISGGWRPLAKLTLVSQSGFAYRALWDTTLRTSAVILLAGVFAGLLISLMLRRITRPVRAVVEQAQAINQRRFITMPLPAAPELRELVSAMNDTVTRLREDFEADARRYDTLRRQANYDPLTGLANRAFFLAILEDALEGEATVYGALAIVRLRYLGKLNRRQGREVADEVLRRVGQAVAQSLGLCSGVFAGRLNGADFALLLPAGCDPLPTLRELQLSLPGIAEPLAGDYATTYIAYAPFAPGETSAGLLSRLDATLAALDVDGHSALREAPADATAEAPAGADQWREAIRAALADRGLMKLARFPIRVGDVVESEFALRLRVAGSDEWLPAGRFLPLAERLGLVPELDQATLDLALDVLAREPDLAGAWINLSAKSIVVSGFRQYLLERLGERPDLAPRLWLEVPEAGGLFRLQALRELARELRPLGCRVGLEHCGHQFDRIGELYELGLDFLKVDASFIDGIDGNAGNQAFLAGLCEIAHRIGMRVFAEGVARTEELETLRALGFDGATGTAVG